MKQGYGDPAGAAVSLAERCDRLEAQARGRAAFLASMSHEIREPMNGVLNMARLLAETPLDDDQREYVEIVRDSSEALLTVLNDILDLSRIDAGKVSLLEVEFDLPALLSRARANMAPRAAAKGVELRFGVDPALPKFVRGDPGRLRQILTNLLGNALKFTEAGFVGLDASLESREGDASAVRIVVEDSGVGLSEAQVATLFQDFAQADGSMQRIYGGSGLGLAISRRLAAMMGGDITAGPRPGGGARFALALPLAVAEEAVGQESGAERRLAGAAILVVDPRAEGRRAIADLCALWGMTARVAATASEAQRLAHEASMRSAPFDYVFLDDELPDGGAMSLGERFGAEVALGAPATVLVSAAGMRGDAARARQAGFSGYLTKPIDAETLRALLSRLAAGDVGFLTSHDLQDKKAPPRRVLLVDDNPVNCRLAVIMLERAGHCVDVVHDGVKALEALTAEAYDLVLMDVVMPVMDGLEATRRIRALEDPVAAATPIVAVTANAMRGDDATCLEVGMNGYVSKPIDAVRLLDAVDAHSRAAA